MDEPPLEAPGESLNHEHTAQTPDNQKTNIEGAGQVLHKGSEHAGVGSSEPTGDKVSGHTPNAGYRQTDRRTSEEAEQRSSQPTEPRLPGHAERRASQQAERRLSEKRTSQPSDQQRPSLSEGKASEKIDSQVSLPSGRKASKQTDQEILEHDDLISSDEADHLPRKSQGQEYKQAENSSNEHRASEDLERDFNELKKSSEKQAPYRSYYSPLAHIESRSLIDVQDTGEPIERVEPCTFENSEAELRSKVSTTEEAESATTVQAYHPPNPEFTTDIQFSHEKLPSITTKVYYSSPEKIQTTEYTSEFSTELEQRRSSQRSSQGYRRRFPPIVFDDPYQVALRYMEKHNVLQIFQITENLVYERPDDPLCFMLKQVQDMIRYRDERRNV